MEIKHIDECNYDAVKEFLLSVKTIKDIDDNVLNNAIVVLDNNEVCGAVSYEKFGSDALIRYFVFKRNLSNDVVIQLFDGLENQAKLANIGDIYCVVNSGPIEELFVQLGFKKEEHKQIYIDESSFDLDGNNNAFVMRKELYIA